MAFYFIKFSAAFTLLLLTLNSINPAQAAERLSFSKVPEKLKILFPDKKTGYFIAMADLNEDGLNEYIFKTPTKDHLLTFEIYALQNTKTISLGAFKGYNLMLGNDYKHGIRNLLVFEDVNNDFSYDVHIWSSQDSHYTSPNTQEDIQ